MPTPALSHATSPVSTNDHVVNQPSNEIESVPSQTLLYPTHSDNEGPSNTNSTTQLQANHGAMSYEQSTNTAQLQPTVGLYDPTVGLYDPTAGQYDGQYDVGAQYDTGTQPTSASGVEQAQDQYPDVGYGVQYDQSTQQPVTMQPLPLTNVAVPPLTTNPMQPMPNSVPDPMMSQAPPTANHAMSHALPTANHMSQVQPIINPMMSQYNGYTSATPTVPYVTERGSNSSTPVPTPHTPVLRQPTPQAMQEKGSQAHTKSPFILKHHVSKSTSHTSF